MAVKATRVSIADVMTRDGERRYARVLTSPVPADRYAFLLRAFLYITPATKLSVVLKSLIAAAFLAPLLFAACGDEEPPPRGMPTEPIESESPTVTHTSPPTTTLQLQTLAYVGEDGGLWIRERNGETRRVFYNDSGYAYYPEWSPDGTKLAFTFVAYLDEGTRGRPLTSYYSMHIIADSGEDIRRLEGALLGHWSPDGNTLSYLKDPTGGDLVVFSVPALLSLETGSITDLTSSVATWDAPRWSPDGRQLAYATADGVYLVEPGSNPTLIVEGTGAQKRYLAPKWSADGRILAFERDTVKPSLESDSYVRLDPEQGVLARVADGYTAKPGRELSFRDLEAHWLPGKTHAAWGAGSGIWIKDMAEPHAEEFIATNGTAHLDVSPNSDYIAFSNGLLPLGVHQPITDRGQIFAVLVAGGNPQFVVNGTYPAWRPNPTPRADVY